MVHYCKVTEGRLPAFERVAVIYRAWRKPSSFFPARWNTKLVASTRNTLYIQSTIFNGGTRLSGILKGFNNICELLPKSRQSSSSLRYMLRGNVTYLLDPLTSTSPLVSFSLPLCYFSSLLDLGKSAVAASSINYLSPKRVQWRLKVLRLEGGRELGGKEGWCNPFDRRD